MTRNRNLRGPDRDRRRHLSSVLKRGVAMFALVASVAAAAATLTADQQSWYRARLGVPGSAMPAVQPQPDALAETIVRWNQLQQSDSWQFADYSQFLLAHPGWPGESAMRRAAERQLNLDSYVPAQAVAFFTRFPPLTSTGRAKYAEALLSSGKPDLARKEAVAVWTRSTMPPDVEARLQSRFGASFDQIAQDQRMEALLWKRSTAAAMRQMAVVSPARRPIYSARLVLQRKDPGALAVVTALGPAAETDAGLLADTALWMRDSTRSLEARALLAKDVRLDAPPYDPAAWLETLVTIARGAAADNQWTNVLGIAKKLDQTYPAGTFVRDRDFGERDDYTTLAWLGGMAAMKQGRAAEAIPLFERYANAAKSPQSQSKGMYWAGRAAHVARDEATAQRFWTSAASYPDQFYGQLANERLGRPLAPPPPLNASQVTAGARAAFEAQELVRAVRMIGELGDWQDQTKFIRALATTAGSDMDHVLVAELAQKIGRPDLGVIMARAARLNGGSDYVRTGFPTLAIAEPLRPYWTQIHAIARQESQFDRMAVSQAGARGMMQLMPGTAREQSGKMGLPYDNMRLTSDPTYNQTLGTAYFQRILDQFGGSYPLAVAAYNAGPGNVRKWIAQNGDPRLPGVDIVQWIELIPFTETRNYVQRVLENAVIYDMLNPNKQAPATMPLSRYLGKTTPG
ncbi:transglycosylase SLT domain-containing protein [Sphingomonas sp. ID0503]|uniref:lytic transglycosylase domain-containing protein n=1 Tax=Sphingomonas sp. ID0503 TaxID=3399691 RepID=UPI003AFA9E5A